MTLRSLILLLVLCTVSPARAEEGLIRAENVAVAAILSPQSFSIENGQSVHLAGIYVPPSFSIKAESWLRDHISGKSLSLWHDDRQEKMPIDRYGQIIAYAQTPDGIFIQSQMIKEGLALVMTQEGSRNLSPALYDAEEISRKEKKGLWTEGAFGIFETTDQSLIPKGQFAVVEGVILQAMDKKDRLYLNFGADWKTDFTLSVAPSVVRLFRAEDKAPANWQGQRVRARGWVESINGPLITITHPEQIEIPE